MTTTATTRSVSDRLKCLSGIYTGAVLRELARAATSACVFADGYTTEDVKKLRRIARLATELRKEIE